MLLLPTAISLLVAVSAQYDPTCLDQLPDCEQYGHDSCVKFPAWAKDKCKNTCGICIGPTKPPPPCVNTLTNCDQYGKAACSNPIYKGWAETKCRYFCRLCPPCVDKVNCREYTKTACTGQFSHWAKLNCPVFCGFCPGGVTPQQVCVNAIPNCALYGAAVCHDTHYKLWAEDNCRQYCGICGGGGVPTVGSVGLQTPGPVYPQIITPAPHMVVPQLPGK